MDWIGPSIVGFIAALAIGSMGLLFRTLRADMSTLKADMRDLKADLKSDIMTLKSDMEREFDRIWKEITLLRSGGDVIGGIVERFFNVPSQITSASGQQTGNVAINSPVTLNSKGQRQAKELGAEELVSKYLDRVIARLPDDAHKLKIQDVCFEFVFNPSYMMSIVTQEERTKIWDAVYESGGNAGDILIVYGILFRDAILKARGFEVPKPTKEPNIPIRS